MKKCLKCHEVKPFEEFFVSRRNRDGFQRWCRSCFAEAQRAHRAKVGIKTKNNRPTKVIKNEFGWVDLTEVKQAEERQGGKCAICQRIRPLVRDHDHKRMKFRGLLCNNCNTGLGYFNDNVDTLKQAIQYLTQEP